VDDDAVGDQPVQPHDIRDAVHLLTSVVDRPRQRRPFRLLLAYIEKYGVLKLR
jgi:hypothetical protein